VKTNFKWEQRSRVDDKRERKAEAESNWRKVCAAVTKREASHCRVSGVRVDPNAPDMLRRGEHHHVVFRSAGGEDTTANVILVSLEVHKAIHAGRIQVEGNGDTGISIWRRGDDGTMYLSIRETSPNVVERD